ncbi:MAG: ABC transporter ATP-binding protein [Planctomycetes bacterium]|nr:ABC transporter ATP-binding protein [Planctomycetota bacterium]
MQSVVVEDLCLNRPRGGFRLGPLSLHLAAGSRTALVGASGSGKTTLLRCIAGLESPQTGRIAIGERTVADGARQLVAPAARRLGVVFQDGALWPHLDAVAHLRFVRPELTRAAALEQLARVGLADRATRKPAQLSGGEAQRLALARALAADPQVLLLDEPLGAVDVHLRDGLALLVRTLAIESSLTVIVVTHDRDEALAMAEDLVVMDQGSIVEHGPAAELVRQPRRAFTARFLGRAACLPIRRDERGEARSALGPVPLPRDADVAAWSHVVLPGDLELDEPATAAALRARVLHVRFDALRGTTAVLAIDGQPVHVACGDAVRAGDELPLRVRGAPRILPATGVAEELR